MLLVAPSAKAGAQRIESRFPRPEPARVAPPAFTALRDSIESQRIARVAVGALGGAIGMISGAVIGYHLERGTEDYCYDWCGLTGGLFGAVFGEAIGFAAGSHVAARPQRSLGEQILLSSVIGGAGLALAFGTNSLVPLLFVVPVQIGTLAF